METPLILGGNVYQLRPTFAALERVEKTLGHTITTLASKLADGELCLREIVIIIAACVEPVVPETDVELLLLGSGFTQVTEALAKMFSHIFQAFDVPCRVTLEELQTQFPD